MERVGTNTETPNIDLNTPGTTSTNPNVSIATSNTADTLTATGDIDLDTVIATDNLGELMKIDIAFNSYWTEKAVEHGAYRCLYYLLTERHVELSQYAFLHAVERDDKTLFTSHGTELDTKEIVHELLIRAYDHQRLEMFRYLVRTYITDRYSTKRSVEKLSNT